MSAGERLVRLAVRLAPAEFRARYGADCIETWRVRRERASQRGPAARLRFAMREVLGTVWLVVRLHGTALGERITGSGRESVARAGSSGAGERGQAVRPGGAVAFDTLGQDIRFAGRTLRRNPGYAAMAVVVLALGIGASAAIFSAVNAFFFRPLPFADADRLVMLYETNPEFEWTDAEAAPANVLDWRERVAAFADVAAYTERVGQVPYVLDGEAVTVGAMSVTGNFFSVLGVRAALGRTFRWEETWSGASNVAILSHSFWTTHFGADRDVIGRSVTFGGTTVEVVGVMPAGFNFPGDDTQLWSPWGWEAEAVQATFFRRAHWVRPIARLESGVTHAQADAEFQSVVRQLQTEYPETNRVMGAGMMPLRDFLIRDVRRPLLILLASVGLLLLLACANVANLTLVRGATRGRELALRHALGAGRFRVARQLLTESVLIAMIGGAAGIGLGWAAVRAMAALTPLGIDGATSIALDIRVILFTLAATLTSGILFGLAPAIRATTGRIHGTLMDGGTGGSPGRGSVRMVSALIAAEVGLALLLVMGAGLMMRSFLLMRQVDPGFRTEGALAVRLSVPGDRYQSRDEVVAFQDRMIEALEGRAGIIRAGFVAQLPLNGTGWSGQFQAAGWPTDRVGLDIVHRRADIGYFEALGIPLIRGRLFERRDGPDAPLVVVINETLAREHFPGEDPIGQKIAYERATTEESTWYEIIGIVGDQHQISLAQPVRAEAFESRHQDWNRFGWFVLRTTGEPMSVLPAVREVVSEIDPLIPIAAARPLHEVWRTSMAREEFILTLLTAFGVVALLLAAVGVYGVTAQAARRRTRELGIRIALGARTGDVMRLMLRQSMAVVAIGLAAGLAVSLIATRALTSVLFGIAPTDPATLVSVVVVLASVAALACYIPARRALALDPVRSLKQQ
jgi:putative ABC transport system permease protein